MLLLAIAAQLSLPVPVNSGAPDIRALFTADDFPDYLLGGDLTLVVYSRTTVRADGSIEGCIVEESSGHAKLDKHTCGIIVRRAKLAPAKWPDGSPVMGVIRAPVTYELFDEVPPSKSA